MVGQKDGQKQPANQKPSIVSAPAAHAGSSLLGSISSNQKPSAEIPKLTPKTTPIPKSIPKLSSNQPTVKKGGLVPPKLTGVGLEDKNDDRSITELLSKSTPSAVTSNLTSSGVTSSTSIVQGQNNSNLSQTKKTPDGKKNEFKHFKKRIQSEFNKTPLLNEIIKVISYVHSNEVKNRHFRVIFRVIEIFDKFCHFSTYRNFREIVSLFEHSNLREIVSLFEQSKFSETYSNRLPNRIFREHRRRTNPHYPHPSLQPKVNMLLSCQRLRLLHRQLLQQLRH